MRTARLTHGAGAASGGEASSHRRIASDLSDAHVLDARCARVKAAVVAVTVVVVVAAGVDTGGVSCRQVQWCADAHTARALALLFHVRVAHSLHYQHDSVLDRRVR